MIIPTITSFIMFFFYSIPLWSLIYCHVFIQKKHAANLLLVVLSLSLLLNILDFADLNLEFYFILFLFIYISAVLVLFIFAYLALPINTANIAPTSSLEIKNYILLAIIGLFWVISEFFDKALEDYTQVISYITTVENLSGSMTPLMFLKTTWIDITQLNQFILLSKLTSSVNSTEALGWFLLTEHISVVLLILLALLMTLFGTLYLFRRTEVVSI